MNVINAILQNGNTKKIALQLKYQKAGRDILNVINAILQKRNTKKAAFQLKYQNAGHVTHS